MIKSGRMTFFTLVNPGMRNGGLFSYSKSDILGKIPKQYRPNELKVAGPISASKLISEIENSGIEYPVIIKGDTGERGKGVYFFSDQEKIIDMDSQQEFLIQEYIDLPLEIGVFYIRFPDNKKGKITSLMERLLLSVTGDGYSNVKELLLKDSRKARYLDKIKNFYPEILEEIPKNEKELIVEPIGNHNRGTIFIDQNDKINEKLESIMDKLLSDLSGFNYGRLDIKTNSWEELENGRSFKVLEINGLNSEPAHIYNPGYPLLKAYKSVFHHWKIAYNIAKMNRRNGLKAEGFIRTLRSYVSYLNS